MLYLLTKLDYLTLGKMTHIDRKIRQKEEVKNNILNAAKNIAASEGWDNVTIRKIAKAIEYTPPIVYEHFENKDDLINELIRSGYSILNKEVIEILNSEKEYKKALKKLSFMFWDFANKNKELYSLMFKLEQIEPGAGRDLFQKIYHILFFPLSSNNIYLSTELYFNWLSVLNGCIFFLLFFSIPSDLPKVSAKKLFEKIIDRFLNSI